MQRVSPFARARCGPSLSNPYCSSSHTALPTEAAGRPALFLAMAVTEKQRSSTDSSFVSIASRAELTDFTQRRKERKGRMTGKSKRPTTHQRAKLQTELSNGGNDGVYDG